MSVPVAAAAWLRFLVGHACDAVLRRGSNWTFGFGGAGSLNVECPWRIVIDGRIALTAEDDGQQFGLPAPISAEDEAHSLVVGRTVTALLISSPAGDLRVEFGSTIALELFNNSRAYEAWEAIVRQDGRPVMVVAHGGGSVGIYEECEPGRWVRRDP